MAVVEINGLKIGQGVPKICVPLVGKTDRELVEQAIHANQCGCDLVELRIDYYERVNTIEKVVDCIHKIKECLSVPILFTFRTFEEGGNQPLSKEYYGKLYDAVIENGSVEVIDLELSLGEMVLRPLIKKARQKGIKVLLSSHDFLKTPVTNEIIARLRRMQELGADIVKIAVMPKSKEDVLRLMDATLYMNNNHSQTPVVGISMGDMGIPSRFLGDWFGSAITFGVASKVSAPGQLSVQRLQQLFKLLTNE